MGKAHSNVGLRLPTSTKIGEAVCVALPGLARFLGEICGLGIVDICRNCGFAAYRIGVSVGHVWFLFVLLLSAADEIWVQKKRVVSDALIAKML